MKIYLASGNLDKKREFQEILSEVEIALPSEDGIEFFPEENGKTFFENSLIKARALWEKTRLPVIADDSGLCVDALGGAPGIFSARYGGPRFMEGLPKGQKIGQDEQNRLLVEQLSAAIAKKGEDFFRYENGPRSCRYVCAAVLLLSPFRFFCAQETLEGAIVEDISDARGEGGFGYDPIVLLPHAKKTVAELSSKEKNAASHRGKAARALRSYIALL